MKNVLKWLFSAIIICLWSHLALGKTIEETREAKASFEVNAGTFIEVDGSNTYMEISSWDQNKVEIRAVLEFKGDENNRILEFLDGFEAQVNDHIRSGSAELYIDTDLEEPNKVQWGTKNFNIVSIGYGDNALRISYYIKVPGGNKLKIKNSYKDIVMVGDFSGDVAITQYSAEVRGTNFNTLSLNLKYGDARFQKLGAATMELYEQKLDIKELGPADITAKYSKLTLEKTEKLKVDAYESKFELGNCTSISGGMKYGGLKVSGRLNEGSLDTYELDTDLNEVGSLRFSKSKYGELRIEKVDVLELNESYEDDFTIRQLGKLTAATKYAKFEISELTGSIRIDGYETDITLSTLSSDATGISMDGKYNKLNVSSGSRAMSLKAKVRYGNIDYPESKMDRVIYIKENSDLEMELKSKSGSKPFVFDLKGYELKATIN